jgi:glycerol-1-phosphate dehydrogenase [NAD(P)+]
VPLLARMLLSPLFIDIRAGAVSGLGDLLSDRRISSDGHVAVAVGPGQGERLMQAIGPALANADVFTVRGGSLEAAGELQAGLRGKNYDALVGIGGGRTLDVAKYAATRLALPMVAVATNLAHDGIASPVSSLLHEGGKGSFGVGLPMAVVVDLDYVRSSPPRMVRSGIGDVVSNLSAIADWQLAGRERQEPVDGLAVTFARTAAEAVLHRTDGIESDRFLTALAEALVLSGMAMAAAGNSRPCSGSDHEILHALDVLFPGAGNHGELAGVGALFSFFLSGDEESAALVDACLRRHELPRLPADLGLSTEQFAEAVVLAPSTRPDRYTILEHLDLDEAAVQARVDAFVEAYAG